MFFKCFWPFTPAVKKIENMYLQHMYLQNMYLQHLFTKLLLCNNYYKGVSYYSYSAFEFHNICLKEWLSWLSLFSDRTLELSEHTPGCQTGVSWGQRRCLLCSFLSLQQLSAWPIVGVQRNIGLNWIKRGRELVCGAVLINVNTAGPNCFVSMETWPQVRVDTSTSQCQVPKESLNSHFLVTSWFSPAGAELLLPEKGPFTERAGWGISKRLSIQTSKEEGSGPTSFFKQYFHSGGRTPGGSFFGQGCEWTNLLLSPGGRIVAS